MDESTLEDFSEAIRGEVIQPGEGEYDEARSVWNAKIDRYPRLIVRASGVADIVGSVDLAREHGVPLAIMCGGHDVAGHAVCDAGLVIDCSLMNGVRVDPEAKTVSVQGGATWGDLNHETHAFGLETVGMADPEVGVAGFTLGGGMGYLSRQHGLAIDNLRSVDVVTADGDLVTASEDEHSELFWALRGGGGNFGVVTRFEFDCHDARPEALNGLFFHPIENARSVLQHYRDFMADAPDEVGAGAGILRIPDAQQFPDDLHGETVALLLVNYMGELDEGRRVIRPLREFGDPLLESVQAKPISEMGSDLLEAGRRNYWTNHYISEITDEAIDTFVDHAVPLPTESSVANFYSVGGAINRVDRDATAYPHREATQLFELAVQWSDPENDGRFLDWAREFHEGMAPYGTGGEYVNNQTDSGTKRVKAAYCDNYERLVAVKNEWDPDNLFRMNQNIEPSV